MRGARELFLGGGRLAGVGVSRRREHGQGQCDRKLFHGRSLGCCSRRSGFTIASKANSHAIILILSLGHHTSSIMDESWSDFCEEFRAGFAMAEVDTNGAIFVGKGEKTALLSLAFRQPPRPGHRRNRHRQDRDAAGAGRRPVARRRSGVRRRHQGRSVGHLRGRRGQGRVGQARQGSRLRLSARRISRGVLGRVRRAGPSGARHHLGDGAAAAVAHDGPQRRAGGRAQHRVPRRRRAGAAAARSEGPARDAGLSRRARRRADDAIRQCLEGHDRHHPAAASGAGEPGRHQVLRRAGAGAERT